MWEYIGIQLALVGITLYFRERHKEIEEFISLTATLFYSYLIARYAAANNAPVEMYAAAMIAFMLALLYAAGFIAKVVGVRI